MSFCNKIKFILVHSPRPVGLMTRNHVFSCNFPAKFAEIINMLSIKTSQCLQTKYIIVILIRFCEKNFKHGWILRHEIFNAFALIFSIILLPLETLFSKSSICLLQTFNQKAYYFKSIVWIWERKLLAFKIWKNPKISFRLG